MGAAADCHCSKNGSRARACLVFVTWLVVKNEIVPMALSPGSKQTIYGIIEDMLAAKR
jgi:hypothetical protein